MTLNINTEDRPHISKLDIQDRIENSVMKTKAANAGRERPIIMYECISQIMDSHTDKGHLNWAEAQRHLADNRAELIAFIKSEALLRYTQSNNRITEHQRCYNDDFEGSFTLSDSARIELKSCPICQDSGIGMAPRWQYTPCAFCAPHAFLRFHEKLKEHGLISKKRIFEKRSALKIEYDEANRYCDEASILNKPDKILITEEKIDALFAIYCRKDYDSERMRAYRSITTEEWDIFWEKEDRLEKKAQKVVLNAVN